MSAMMLSAALLLASSEEDALPDAATLFAFRQATIDSIRNFEVECYCVWKSSSEKEGESVFGPLTYRRSGESIMYVNASERAFSQDFVTPERTKSLESTPEKKPKFGIVDKPGNAHYCRDPWYFSRYVANSSQSKEHMPYTKLYSQEKLKNAKVEKVTDEIFRVVFADKDSVALYEFDRSIGYQFRRKFKEFVADEVGGRKVEGVKIRSEVTFEDYVFVNKIPVVKTIKERTSIFGVTHDIVMTLSNIVVNSSEIDRKMTLEFPVGLPVDDYIDQVSYVVGHDGERLNVKPIEITRMMPPPLIPSVTVEPTPAVEPMPAVEPIPAVEDSAYPTYAWALALSFALMVVAFIFRWRMRRRSGDL